jgi:drug/metabolite transporter (DMT)-like permease
MSALLALLSALVWGTSDFGAGLLSRRLRPLVVIAWSQAIALLTLMVVVAFRGLPEAPLGDWVPWAVGAGVTGSLGLLAFYAALATGTMGVVAPIAALGAAIPVLLGVLSGESPSPIAWAGIVVAIIGVVLASGPELQQGLGARPVLLACLAAVGFGLTLFAIDRGARVTLLHTLWGMRLTSCLGYAAIALSVRSLGGLGRRDVGLVGAVGLGDLLANALFGAASSIGMLSIASVLGSLYPVATILLARRFLHEQLRRVQTVGVTVAMLGIVLIAGFGRAG